METPANCSKVTKVAIRSWRDHSAAHRLRERIAAVADDGGLVRVDASLIAHATTIAEEHGISAYDAAYLRQLELRTVNS
jgi:predicted nucleic acid-binding protein